jgi:hypothetical protein
MVQAINSITTNTNLQARKSAPQQAYFSAPTTSLPQGERQYCIFNQNKVNFIVSQKENALPYVKEILKNSKDEKEIVEALYILDKLADKKVKGIPAMYPLLAKYNNTPSPNIQAFLAGIYRKIQVPDAFGPLVSMLIRNSMSKPAAQTLQTSNPPHLIFDPNEEIGGAILEYIRNYSQGPKPIDYSA